MTDIGSIRAFITADSTDYDQKLDKAGKKAESFSKRAQKSFDKVGKGLSSIGRGLTVGLTLPLAAASAGFIKLASDAEETSQKFDVVFASVAVSANEMADSLAASFGFAADESRDLLGTTGDLLTGFGFSQEAALDLAFQVNTLSADLASFSNIEGGSARASEALTKALLGETEQAKALGVVIRQDSDEFRDLVKVQMDSHGMSLLQAKAIASLTIATNQSKNAIGDFARTADSFANQMRIMRAESRDMAVSFGKQLLPVAKALLSWARDISEAWGELNPRTQRLAIIIGAVAGAIGPLLFVAGKIVSGFGTLIGLAGTLASGLASLGGVILTIVSGPLLAIAAGIILVVAATSDLIDWVGLLGSAWNLAVDAFRSVANFFAEFGQFLRDENADISENTMLAIEVIAKAWLSLRIAWNAVLVGLKTVAQGLIKIMQGVIAPFRKAAEFFGLEIAGSLKKAEDAMGSWVATLEKSKETNFEAITAMKDQWGAAPEALRSDVNALVDTFKAIPDGIMSQIESAFPGTVEAIRNLMAQVQEFINTGAVPAIEVPIVPTFGGAGGGAAADAQSNFLTAFDTTTADFLAMNEEFNMAIDEMEAARLETSKNRWQEWADSVSQTMSRWQVSLVNSFTDVAATIVTTLITEKNAAKALKQTLVSSFSSLSQQLIAMALKAAAVQIAIDSGIVAANSAAAAPNPFLIPLFVGLGLAALAAGLAKSGSPVGAPGSGGGGYGEGSLSQIDTAIIPQANQSQVVGDPETENLGALERTQKLVLSFTDEMGNNFMNWIQEQNDLGKGDGVRKFATVGE